MKKKTPPANVPETPSEQIQISYIPLYQLSASPLNPRKSFDHDDLVDLAKSIAEKGVLQPILVRPDADGYEIIAGERRVRACRMLHQDPILTAGRPVGAPETIPAIIRHLADEEAMELQIIENLQRRDIEMGTVWLAATLITVLVIIIMHHC